MVADDSNEFAFRMFGQLRPRSGNLFFSPLSVRTALAMAHAGARGQTESEMRDTLCIPSSEDAAQFPLAKIVARLNAAASGCCEIAVVNSLWSQDGAPLQRDYLEVIARQHSGSMNVVNFKDATESAREAINRWAADQTRQRIQDLLPKNTLTPVSRLVLANVVYFKAKWQMPFRTEVTRRKTFYLEGNGTVETPLMAQRDDFRYMKGRGFQAVELAYQGTDLAMLALLPDQKDGVRQVEDMLSVPMLKDCIAQMAFRPVVLVLPRFKITWSADVRPLLTNMGMGLAFSESADFSGINGRTPPDPEALFLSAVLHKAFVEADEKGTEAAAATAGLVLGERGRVEPPVVFQADHPFLFAIRDRATGVIVFLGRVADPTS